MEQERSAIVKLLTERIGLEIATIGERKLAKAIATRQKACELPTLEDYRQRVQFSAVEFQELVEWLVIPETWFFRHREAFNLLRHHIKSEWLPHHRSKMLRVLSLPCSTGEEAYSLAITLLEAGLAPQQFQIDGMDISHQALQKARFATYSHNSFRERDLPAKKRFFHPVPEGGQICQFLRDRVNFSQRNLLAPWLPLPAPYDIIFCRHLLIYLDSPARTQAIELLSRLLCDRGLLFVGAAETSAIVSPRLHHVPFPSAFAFQKGDNQDKPLTAQAPVSSNVTARIRATVANNVKPGNSFGLLLPSKSSLLADARQLADRAQFSEATARCWQCLERYPTDEAAHLLLGEIYQAQGECDRAEQCYQKVLYLNPDDDQALTHLALLKESRGDIVGANLIKQRIQRLLNLKAQSR